ncbi:CHASE2 domain-containing protein [Deinococcus puniceus]|uniref:Diguanylate cyclase n=1 Tax=Deinococcus puniceus TaxID=1182568 RepID=A0A172T8J5_9DEIO|nr:CHASE2 domain-containing protein [Deinococcus puniceus]ANE43330.1 diguanylate cyclase [Deinococcus puniceus]
MLLSPESSLARYTVPAAAVLAAALALLLPDNVRLQDALNRALPSPADTRVVVVGIDDASLRDYGRLDSWPRELYGQALNTLDEAGARAIGIDVILSDPAQNDQRLADAFSRPNVVLATAPGEDSPANPDWRSPTGVSALNIASDGLVRSFQAAYRENDTASAQSKLVPSLARQVAVIAGRDVPLDTTPRVLRYSRPDLERLPVLSFRDVVNGNVRYSDLQGRVVLIGLTATGLGNGGLGGQTLRDVTGEVVSGALLQARAVSSLLSAPFQPIPVWLTVLLCVLAASAAVLARGLWGFGIAMLALSLAVPLWLANIVLPGVTISLAAILGTALVALERWWNLRNLGTLDPLTGFGNRLAFTRAVEHRWAARTERPLGLLLVDLSGFRKVNDTYGRNAGDELLRDLAARIQTHKRRGDVIFRWGADEFAILLDNTDDLDLAVITERVQRSLDTIQYRDIPLRASVGAATTTPDIRTPIELIEAASRSRYRMKYQRDQRE